MGADDLGAKLVGTWRLVAASYRSTSGEPAASPLGAHPAGLLIYTSDGHIAALVSHAGRRLLSVGDRLASEPDERADAFATFFSYGGRYAVRDHEVRHRVEVASIENWVGSEFVRQARLEGERLFLRTPPTLVGGAERVVELIWERVECRPVSRRRRGEG